MSKKYKIQLKTPTIRYSSSLIQQNHGESLDGHGMTVWDVNNRTYEHIEIKNDYGYYTLNIENGIVPDVNDMPKTPRLRIRVTDTNAAQLKRALVKVRRKYNVKEYTVTRIDTISRMKSGDRDNKLNLGNVSDIEYQNELIRDYLNRQLFVDGETIQDIFKINRELNSELDENDIAKNVNWKPKRFSFSNMFSYGENNVVEFDDMRGVYGLFAPNASGKSSIFDAISYCIFDKCSRAFKASHVMNNQKSNFDCLLELEIDGIDYFIRRRAARKKDGSVKVDVNFWKQEDGVQINLNGERRNSTNSIIRRYIGSYEDFVLTTLSLQNQNAIFIDKSQSERKDLLAQFMGIDIFDKLYQIASENIKDVSGQIRKMKTIDYDSKLITLGDNLKKYRYSYNAEESKLNKLKIETNKLSDTKLKLVRELVNVNPGISDITALNQNKELLDSRVEVANNELIELISDIKKLAVLINRDIARIAEHDGTDIESIYETYIKNVNRDKELTSEIEDIRNEIERKSEQLYEYDGLDWNLDCSNCLENAEKLSSSSVSIKKEMVQLTKDMKLLLMESNTLTETLKNSMYIVDEWNIYNELKNKVSQSTIKKSTLETTSAKKKIEIQNYKNKLKDIKNSIEEYYNMEDAINNNQKLNSEIRQIDIQLAEIERDSKAISKTLLDINGMLASTQTSLDVCNADLEQLNQLENEYKTYEYYLAAIKRDGIPYELIMKALPIIEGEVNNILQQVVDFGMQLEMDGKNINGKLVYETSAWPLEMCSGMERFISGLAIRVALMNICHLPRSNFLVLDEGMGTLDSNNINNLAWLFDYLKGQFDFIMVISHLDVMRDIIDNLIEIKKEDGFSSIQF